MTESLLTGPVARAIGLALVQFVWQGAVVGAVAALLLACLRRASPQIRYGVASVALAVMATLPVMTSLRHLNDARPAVVAVEGARTAPSVATPVPGQDVPVRAFPRDEGTPARFTREWLDARLPAVTAAWALGVILFALLLFRGWLRLGRLRRNAVPILTPQWTTTMYALADRLGVTRPVALVESALVEVPAVVGHLRPLIFIPASALTGLSPAYFEAILAHELAHIRRADYLVNAAQCVVEVLLFYHPAVWWVSKQMRSERELCCDDLAVAACGDRLTYARALASLEELRSPTSALVVAADGGDLLARVRRLVGDRSVSGPRRSGGAAMGIVLTIVLFAVGGGVGRVPADAKAIDESPTTASAPAAIQPVPRSSAIALVQQRASVPKSLPARTVAKAPVAVAAPERDQAPAQTDRGSIAGVVMDPSGGVVPGATITLTPVGSTASTTVRTNAPGRFRVDDLLVGLYDVRITLAGFRETSAKVPVGAGAVANVSVRLQMGGLMESVSVRRTPGARPTTASVTSSAGTTAQNLFDAARVLGEQGHMAEAEEMAARALAVLRSGMALSGTVSMAPLAPAPPAGNAAAGMQGPATPIRVGGDIRAPRKVRDVKPIYPADAGQVEGVVLIEATIAKDGSVQNASVLRGVPALNEAALAAVRQWRFTPTLLNGVAVDVVMTVTVTFGG